MDIDVRFDGMDELNKTLLEMTKSLDPAKVEPLLKAGAKMIADAARSKAPKGPTGNLKKSIKVKQLTRRGNQPTPFIAAVDRKRAAHAHLVEYGTSGERIGKKGSRKYRGKSFGTMPAKPFFRPAIDEKSAAVINHVQSGIKKLIEEAVK